MLLPAQVVESDMPPTDFRLRMRKWVSLFGIIQFLCVLGRIVVGDMMGALCMLFVVSMAYQISFGDPPMHIRWIFMWAFFCFINAGFDFAIASVRTMHIYHHYDDPKSTDDIKGQVPFWRIVVVLIVSWVGALSEIFGAWLGYKLYQDFQDQELAAFGTLGGVVPPMYGAFGGRYSVGTPTVGGHSSQNIVVGPGIPSGGSWQGNTVVSSASTGVGASVGGPTPSPTAPTLQPFMGKGHKLEDS